MREFGELNSRRSRSSGHVTETMQRHYSTVNADSTDSEVQVSGAILHMDTDLTVPIDVRVAGIASNFARRLIEI